jgi:predicted amidohydrolase YtcJ
MASASAATQLIHDATIVTADQAGSILYGAALAVRDGRIAALARWRP